MRALSVVSALILASSLCAQGPVFQWAETVPNVSTPGTGGSTRDAAVAPDGGAYVTGSVSGIRAIVGDFIVEGSTFVARYDTSGTCLWAKSPGGRQVAANGSNGVYVVGGFTGTLQFGGTSMTAIGYDGYVAKYDANGQLLWAEQMGGPLNDIALSVAVDGLGRVHVGGFFQGTGTFGGSTLVATQDSTGFHATYDTNGALEWVRAAGGFNSTQGINPTNALTCDAAGNTIMTGNFDDTGTFGSTTLTATGNDKLYLARFDASGNETWVHAMGSTGYNSPVDVRIAPSGNIYLYGVFRGSTATFGGTTLANAVPGFTMGFLALYGPGGSLQWAQLVGTSILVYDYESLDVDDLGHAWVSGHNNITSQFGTITLNGAGPFLAQYSEAGTAVLAEHIAMEANVFHALGTHGDHFLYGDHINGTVFDQGSGISVSAALEQAKEGYLARYDEDLEYRWMRRMGLHGTAYDGGTAILIDASGNVYTYGLFITTAILCDDTLRAPLAASHLWLNKRDANGACIWTQQFTCSEPLGPNQVNRAVSLVMDDNGDLYLSGTFFGTIQIGAYMLTSAGGQDLFLARLDGSGNCQWAVREGGTGKEEGGAIAIDGNGDLLLTGGYAGTCTIAGVALTSQGQSDGFVARYDGNGNASWVRSFGGTSWDSGTGVAVDAVGNGYITGRYTTNATFNGLVVNGTGDMDIFVAKYDPAGAILWLTGSTSNGRKTSAGVVLGVNDQVYITGQYYGEMTVGTSTLVGDPAINRPFLGCFDTGGALLWQKDLPCTGGGGGLALAARPVGDIVVGGTFSGTLNVDADILAAIGFSDAWVAGFTATGVMLWTQAISGTDLFDIAIVYGLAADADNVHLAGSCGNLLFSALDQPVGTCTFDPGNPGSVRFASNSLDAFVAKYSADESTSIQEAFRASEGVLRIAPNPVDRMFTVECKDPLIGTRITLRDMAGREMQVPFVIQGNKAVIDAAALALGSYAVSVITASAVITGRFVKE